MMALLKRTGSGLRYSLYVMVHPFKGFWDLKHEKCGNLPAALCILAAAVITFVMRSQLTGFLINESDPTQSNILFQATSVLLPFLLWCVSNWCITTLMDGEGFFSDILVTSCYALAPLILFNIPMVLLSRVLTLSETPFYMVLNVISILWAVMLLLTGLMTIHQFTMSKTLVTVLIALLTMVIILFIVLLFFTLVQNILNFLRLICNEAQMRLSY